MFEAILARLGRELDAADLPYMVIGGQAVLLYGEPRLTDDIDITLGATLDRLPDVLKLTSSMGLGALCCHPLEYAVGSTLLIIGFW